MHSYVYMCAYVFMRILLCCMSFAMQWPVSLPVVTVPLSFRLHILQLLLLFRPFFYILRFLWMIREHFAEKRNIYIFMLSGRCVWRRQIAVYIHIDIQTYTTKNFSLMAHIYTYSLYQVHRFVKIKYNSVPFLSLSPCASFCSLYFLINCSSKHSANFF